MANTFTSLHYHLVFSTKNREPWIGRADEERLWAYVGGIARQNQMQPIRVGGTEDHVHILLGIAARISVSEAVKEIKGASSGWIKENLERCRGFAWQDGYSAFTVSKSQMSEVEDYIRSQREHHRIKTFQEEFLALLTRHQIKYDERYLWG
jgi:REP element-mobilizing transposase RayT